MKENSHIDELLNGFIDGELSQRQITEVQRLIAHDTGVLERLNELKKCKMLVRSLPCEQAPAEMLGDIKASLERNSLLTHHGHAADQDRGARHLMFRKILTAAAMIALFAVLGTVIYNIIDSGTVTEKQFAVKQWEQPVETPVPEKSVPVVPVAVEKAFAAKLELGTSDFSAAEAAIKKAIEDSDLLQYVKSRGQQGQGTYSLECGRGEMTLLLVELDGIWEAFDSAKLVIESTESDGDIEISFVTAGQIAEIANQDSPQKRLEMAKNFKVLNTIAKLLEDEDPDATTLPLIVPKPVLTSASKSDKTPDTEAEIAEKVRLTIILIGRE